ncbi:MAG: histidine ammonia-lyase [Coriobacteriales bacterium]|nr:histidine ammonia-lyase [Coriobacteriales bacterium]
MTVVLGIGPLAVDDVVAVARRGAEVEISTDACAAMEASRKRVDELAGSGRAVYGVSTGFGALATSFVDPAKRRSLQRSLIRSHSAGSGEPVEREVVRSLMLLRLATLCGGHSGVRVETAETYAALLNASITPVVPEFGSLGCSGDLAPLAHCALVAMGEGEVLDDRGCRVPAAGALAAAGIEPIDLVEKEGLALVNGTDGMLGMLCLAIADLRELARIADISAAMSLEALLGTDRVLEADLQALRPHPGQAASARNMMRLLADSGIIASHRSQDPRVQDAYSVRCAPQVAGALRDTLAHAEVVAERELDACVDNPVVLDDGSVQSNGNFHGAPLAYVLDFLAIVGADLASMSERRTDRMLDPARSGGLPPFLAADPGVDSGLMIAQYTQAATVSEMKRLASPASVDSIPSSAMQEDHVSMGWHGGRKLRRAIDGLTRVLAIEIMTAARALDLREPLASGAGTDAVRNLVREHVPGMGPDRYLAPEVESVRELVASGAVVRTAETAVGELE